MKNNFEQNLGKVLPKKESEQDVLSMEEKSVINSKADCRIRAQKLKIQILNLEIPLTPEIIEAYEKTRQIILKEAGGEIEMEKKTENEFIEEADKLSNRADKKRNIVPNFSAYLYAEAAKNYELAGKDFKVVFEKANECLEESADIPQNTPSSLLPDAILHGISTRQLKKSRLPQQEKIAEAIMNDPKLLENYSLVLSEEERAEFLILIPEEKRKVISQAMDASVSRFLHQSVVKAKSLESTQRSSVLIRAEENLENILNERNSEDKIIARMISDIFNNLGGDAPGVLVRIAVAEYEKQKYDKPDWKEDILPRILTIILEEFNDPRGNDMALQLAADERMHPSIRTYLMKKLTDNGYLEKDLEELWNERKMKNLKKSSEQEKEDKKYRIDVFGKIVSELGVIPTKSVAEFIMDDNIWGDGPRILTLDERITKIKESQKEFEQINNYKDLISELKKSKNAAMTYFLLNGGNDRFGRYNNYTFEKFWDILDLIDSFNIHKKPLNIFSESLIEVGFSDNKADKFIEHLINGEFPLDNVNQSYQECILDVSQNERLISANHDLAVVLGKKQLGVILKSPIYRKFLINENPNLSAEFLKKINDAKTFIERESVIEEIETKFPDLRKNTMKKILESWSQLNEKMLLGLSLETVFENDLAPVKGEDLLPLLDTKRIDLKRIKKETIVALKGDNAELKIIQSAIYKKKKAINNLLQGVERQEDQDIQNELNGKIRKIRDEISLLENKRDEVSGRYIDERYKGLSEEEKKDQLDQISKEIIALTEKDSSAIFTYVIMQVLEQEKLTEDDIGLMKEMEDHLKGPFQALKDFSYFKEKSTEIRQEQISLHYLNKVERLMTMVRFADSFTCCFTTSSSNYDNPNSFAFNQPNKLWVASINADPMSFVISIEQSSQASGQSKKVHENIGFIFGSYALNDKRQPAIMLNGFYSPYKKGEDVEIILQQIEKIFKGSNIKTIAFASQHGGSLTGIPKGYKNSNIDMIRLRALDGGNGTPEDTIYDDLGTGKDLNRPHNYGGHVWHKKIN